jgi:hypothetical protein
LEKREPQLKVGERIIIDDAVLKGLLSILRCLYGARWLEMILAMSTVSGRKEFERAAPPPEAQLNLHVNAKEFMNLVRYCRLPERLREIIVRELDDVYKHQREEMVVAEEDNKVLVKTLRYGTGMICTSKTRSLHEVKQTIFRTNCEW